MTSLMNIDSSILLWIQEYIRTDWLTPIMKGITHLGDTGIFWIILTIILIAIPKTRKIGYACAIALIINALLCNVILKPLFNRPRPYTQIEGLVLLVKEVNDASFPSGHASASIAASLVTLTMLPKKYGIPLFILAILISLSRLYVGIHYPTDVLGGVAVGIISFLLVNMVYNQIFIKE